MSEPQVITMDGVTPGMELEETVFGPLHRDDFVRYAEASGDDNPMHQDEAYARANGAPTIFAMGMLPAGFLAHAVADWFGSPEHLRRYKVRFTTRVWAGDQLVCSGNVVSIEDGILKVSVQAKRRGAKVEGLDLPEEETAIVGEADIELPE
jgi:acyl dehydratase